MGLEASDRDQEARRSDDDAELDAAHERLWTLRALRGATDTIRQDAPDLGRLSRSLGWELDAASAVRGIALLHIFRLWLLDDESAELGAHWPIDTLRMLGARGYFEELEAAWNSKGIAPPPDVDAN